MAYVIRRGYTGLAVKKMQHYLNVLRTSYPDLPVLKEDGSFGSATENAVFCGNTIVALTQTELRLLSYMMKQPEKAYSREELLSAVWGFDSEVETRVTDETLRRIRKKLLQAGSTVSVSTIWGFGYKLKGAGSV